MTIFRPCIDLHQGQVKQIVGGTLTDSGQGLRTNFVAEQDSRWFAELYRKDGLRGGHVIMLGPGNREAALAALRAYPGGLQIGGGLDDTNVLPYLDAGASHVILTSWLFPGGRLSMERLGRISDLVGRERLVVDLSCRRVGDSWHVAMNRWQTVTEVRLDAGLLAGLAAHCDEFLIHAADVEGRCEGMDWDLVAFLARHSPLPTTYAGGARDIADLSRLESESRGRLDLSIGSALDIFGGGLVRYADCAAFNRGRTASGDGPRSNPGPAA
jgi:phosphoribosylformimino-5-aminoimidazole carboxamide ribotide isomerase